MLLISFLFLRPDPDPEVKKTEACVCVWVCVYVCVLGLCKCIYVCTKEEELPDNAICWGDNRVGRYSVQQEKQFV